MADSIKLTLLTKLTALLETVTIANGFEFDLAGKVFRGRSVYGDDAPETMLSILEAPRQENSFFTGNGQVRYQGWVLLIQGWTKDDPENPTDPVYRLAADVEKRLSIVTAEGGNGAPVDPEQFMLGNTLALFEVEPFVVRPPQKDLSNKAFFYLPVKLGLGSFVG